MDKIHYQTDQEDLAKLCDGQMFTMYDGNIKSAASDAFTADMLRQHAPDDKHFMLHVIAMGAGETYSCNRNGDYFAKEALQKYHDTFVKHGCFFREHRNRCQKTQGIGTIKASAYNEKMERVELVVWGDKEKAAKEYEMAKSGKALSFSMSCKIARDCCSCCGNEATSPANYCTHLKHSMLQYIPEFKKYAYALNPVPKFFDISAVDKPADRIAHYLDYAFQGDTEKKASADTSVIYGTSWAAYEGVSLPDDPYTWSPEQTAMLTKLASAVDYIQGTTSTKSASTDAKVAFARNITPYAFTEGLADEDIAKLRTLQVGTVFGELAKRACILPFPEFIAYATGTTLNEVTNDPVVKRACCMLPGIFNTLMGSGCSCGQSMGNLFNASSDYACKEDPANDDVVQQMMDMADKKFSIKSEPVKHRVMTVTIIKKASTPTLTPSTVLLTPALENKALSLAQTYGMYKLSAMLDIARIHTDNIDDPQYLLAAAQHIFN